MILDTDVMYCVKGKIKQVLKTLNYDYFIDVVLSITEPTCISIVLYGKNEASKVEKYLTEHGFILSSDRYDHNHESINMKYRNMIYIEIMKNGDIYRTMKHRNDKILLINLGNIVKQMVKQDYSISDIYKALIELSVCK